MQLLRVQDFTELADIVSWLKEDDLFLSSFLDQAVDSSDFPFSSSLPCLHFTLKEVK